MWKIFFFLCALAITSKCNGDRSDAVEMKSFMVKPMNTQQLQALMSLRNSHPQVCNFDTQKRSVSIIEKH